MLIGEACLNGESVLRSGLAAQGSERPAPTDTDYPGVLSGLL